jgi:hypothetical protein
MWRRIQHLFGRQVDFEPGERVVHTESGDRATVARSERGRSHVYWDDDQPPEDFGGSVVANESLRVERNAPHPRKRKA